LATDMASGVLVGNISTHFENASIITKQYCLPSLWIKQTQFTHGAEL